MRSSFFSLILIPLLAVCLFSLTGCNEAQIARAEAGVSEAQKILDTAKAHQADAEAALSEARVIAQTMGATQGAALLAKVQAAATDAQALVPIAQQAVDTSKAAVAAARAAQDAGGSTWQVLGAIGMALLTGGGGVGLLAQRGSAVAATALQIVGDFSRSAAAADTDEQVLAARGAALKAAAGNPAVAALVAPHVTG